MGAYDGMSDDQINQLVQQKLGGSSLQSLPAVSNSLSATPPDFNSLSDDQLNQMIQQKNSQKTQDPTAMPGFANSVTTKQQTPDDVSYWNKFVAENFSNSPYASMQYLAQKYPDYDLRHDGNQILMKKKDSTQWQALSPKMDLTNPKTIAGALSDNVVPFAQGAVSNAAADAAGAATALTPAAPAAIPAAMAAGAGTNAGLEALKTKIGSWLGLPQELNKSDLGWAAAGGALSPLLFGTGGSASKIAEKAAAKGLTQDAAETAINSQKGVLPSLGAPVTGFLTGTPAQTVATAYNRMPELQQMEKEGVTALASSAADSLKGKLTTATKNVGDQIGQALQDSGQNVDISGAKAALQSRITQLEGLYAQAPTPATQAELAQAKNSFQDLFTQQNPAEEASGLLGPDGKPVTPGAPASTSPLPDQMDPKVAMNLLQQLKEHAGLLSRAGIGAADAKPVATKMLQGAATSAYQDLSDQIEQVLADSGNDGLRDQYANLKDLQRTILPVFDDPAKTYNTLRTMGSKSKKVLFESLQGVDDNLGTNLVDDAKLVDAYSTYSSPKFFNGGTPLALAGAGAGLYAGNQEGGGHGYTGPALGAMIGAGLGKFAGSPGATRYLAMPFARAAESTLPTAIPGIWDALRSRIEQNDIKNPERNVAP